MKMENDTAPATQNVNIEEVIPPVVWEAMADLFRFVSNQKGVNIISGISYAATLINEQQQQTRWAQFHFVPNKNPIDFVVAVIIDNNVNNGYRPNSAYVSSHYSGLHMAVKDCSLDEIKKLKDYIRNLTSETIAKP